MSDNTWPDGPPEDAYYMGFTIDHDEEAAAALFVERQGREPEWIFEALNMLRVGPKDD